jgi:2-methylisocitrate lyase-like PEP mutase family enzyme
MESLNRRLRRELVAGAGLLMPGAGNALAARMIEAAGFPLFFASGAAIATNYLGAPDIGLVSVSELAANVAAMRDAANIPMIVDADTGFGETPSVRRTVRTLERAGANAVMIEDLAAAGHGSTGAGIIAEAAMVGKIKAAVDARDDADLMIVARTAARKSEGLAAALERLRAYGAAGADAFFLDSLQSAEELAAVPREVPGIHICFLFAGGALPMLSQKEMAALGYAAAGHANTALHAGMRAMDQALRHIRDTGSAAGLDPSLMSAADRQRLLKAP